MEFLKKPSTAEVGGEEIANVIPPIIMPPLNPTNDRTVESDMESDKVLIFLRPVGEAPTLKKSKYKLDGKKCINDVEKFLKKVLGTTSSLYLYCGTGFSPTPDQNLQDLYDCFQVGSELVITYGINEAWG